MARLSSRHGYLLALLALAVFSAGGCQTLLLFPLWVLHGTDVPAKYEVLEDKTVAVVCRPVPALMYSSAMVDRDLAREVNRLLQLNGRKIHVIPQRDVVEWLDENGDWSDYTEVGRGLGADMVLGIDLQDFELELDSTLYQGRASLAVQVFDCNVQGEPVVEFELPQMIYPPNVGVPATDKPKRVFRNEYVRVLADQIGRYFYAHDPHTDYALDAKAYQ